MPCSAPTTTVRDAERRLGQHLLAVVRAQDAAISADRRVPRTVEEMRARLTARMADDACPLCGRWQCAPSHCPPPSAAPALPAGTMAGGGQCSACGGTFPGWNGGVCIACRAAGRG
ncbi:MULTISPECIES: hypothetical protein [unclassified Streptomyces]|uniref:hypothetical protein n=1 Tax=unclassified Streptomyces TaxID=2593676 RepID=UPI003702B64E